MAEKEKSASEKSRESETTTEQSAESKFQESSLLSMVEDTDQDTGSFIDGGFAGVVTEQEAIDRDTWYSYSQEDRTQDHEQWSVDAIDYEVQARHRSPTQAGVESDKTEVSTDSRSWGGFEDLFAGISDYAQSMKLAYDNLTTGEKRVLNKVKSREGRFLYEMGRSHGGDLLFLGGAIGAATLGLPFFSVSMLVGAGLSATASALVASLTRPPEELEGSYSSLIGNIAGARSNLEDAGRMTDTEQFRAVWWNEFIDNVTLGKALDYTIGGFKAITNPVAKRMTDRRSTEVIREDYVKNELTFHPSVDEKTYREMAELEWGKLDESTQDLIQKADAYKDIPALKEFIDENTTVQKRLGKITENYDSVELYTKTITELLEEDAAIEQFIKRINSTMPIDEVVDVGSKLPPLKGQFERRAGNRLDRYFKTGDIKYLNEYTPLTVKSIPDRGALRKAQAGEEAYKKSLETTPSEEALAEGTREVGKVEFFKRDYHRLKDQQLKVFSKHGLNEEYHAIGEAVQALDYYAIRRATVDGKNLQATSAHLARRKRINKLYKDHEKLIQKHREGLVSKREFSAKEKNIKKAMEELKLGEEKSWLNPAVALANLMRVDTLLSQGAFKSAALGSLATGATSLIDLSMRKNNPFYLIKGLTHSLMGGSKGLRDSFVPGYGGWKRRWADMTGESKYKGRHVEEANKEMFKSKSMKAAHAVLSTNLQMMKEFDHLAVDLFDHVSGTTALRDLIGEMAAEGIPLKQIKHQIIGALKSGKTPHEFTTRYMMLKESLTDKMLFRGSVELDKVWSPLSIIGTGLYKSAKWMHNSHALGKLGGTIVAPFSTSAANALDWVARKSVLGSFGLRGVRVTEEQIRGTMYAMWAYIASKDWDNQTFIGGRGDRSKFFGLGGDRGVEIGGKTYKYSDFGGVGEIVDLMTGLLESFEFYGNWVEEQGEGVFGEDETGNLLHDDSEMLLGSVKDFMGVIVNDTWLSMGLYKYLTAINAPDNYSQTVLERELNTFVPFKGLLSRANSVFYGEKYASQDFWSELNRLFELKEKVLIDGPARDALGVPRTQGELDREQFRKDDQEFGWAMFVDRTKRFINPNEKGPRPKSNELRRRLVDLGMFNASNVVKIGDVQIDKVRLSSVAHDLRPFVLSRPTKSAKILSKPGSTFPVTPRQYNIKLEGVALDYKLAKDRMESFKSYIDSQVPESELESRTLEEFSKAAGLNIELYSKKAFEDTIRPYWPGYNADRHNLVDILHHYATANPKTLAKSKLFNDHLNGLYPAIRSIIRDDAFLSNKLTDNEIKKFAISYTRSKFIWELYDLAKAMGEKLVAFDPEMIKLTIDGIRTSEGEKNANN